MKESVTYHAVVDLPDVAARLNEIRNLKDGWLDGKGRAPSASGLEWFARILRKLGTKGTPPPYLYPTPEGGVRAEWSLGSQDVSLDVDCDRHSGEWHRLDTSSNSGDFRALGMDDEGIVNWIADELRSLQRPMDDATLLLRQVHPAFVHCGRVTSQVFRPTPKDESRLSVYNADMISAEDAWRHFTSELHFESVGVLAVSVGECRREQLSVAPDPTPFASHTVISYVGLSNSQIEAKSKRLRNHATDRGWLFQPESAG